MQKIILVNTSNIIIMLSTKKNNSFIYANNGTFDNINLTSGKPIIKLDYLQSNYY